MAPFSKSSVTFGWHNEGGKNKKYFLSLEKRHYKQSTISRLKKNRNELAVLDKKILTEWMAHWFCLLSFFAVFVLIVLNHIRKF